MEHGGSASPCLPASFAKGTELNTFLCRSTLLLGAPCLRPWPAPSMLRPHAHCQMFMLYMFVYWLEAAVADGRCLECSTRPGTPALRLLEALASLGDPRPSSYTGGGRHCFGPVDWSQRLLCCHAAAGTTRVANAAYEAWQGSTAIYQACQLQQSSDNESWQRSE